MDTGVSSGHVGVNLDTLNSRINSDSVFGSEMTTFTIGSQQYPFPINMELEPIYTMLEPQYWPAQYMANGETYESLRLQQKMGFIRYMYDRYPQRVGQRVTGEKTKSFF